MKLFDEDGASMTTNEVVESLRQLGYDVKPPCKQTRALQKILMDCSVIGATEKTPIFDTPEGVSSKIRALAGNIATRAWEACITSIHGELGVESGDQASYFFANSVDEELVVKYITDYVMSEIRLYLPEVKLDGLDIDAIEKACCEPKLKSLVMRAWEYASERNYGKFPPHNNNHTKGKEQT